MHKYCISVMLICFPVFTSGAGLMSSLKEKFQITKCLQSNTQQMCTFEGIYKKSPKQALKKQMVVSGISGRYTLRSPNSDWSRLWPDDNKRREDLVVMHKSMHAFIQVAWQHKAGDYEKTAKSHFKQMVARFKAEPTRIPLDVWPYRENGALYEMCYRTDKKTQECLYSAAANMAGGMVSFFSITAFEEKLVEDILFLIASVDMPETAMKKKKVK